MSATLPGQHVTWTVLARQCTHLGLLPAYQRSGVAWSPGPVTDTLWVQPDVREGARCLCCGDRCTPVECRRSERGVEGEYVVVAVGKSGLVQRRCDLARSFAHVQALILAELRDTYLSARSKGSPQ